MAKQFITFDTEKEIKKKDSTISYIRKVSKEITVDLLFKDFDCYCEFNNDSIEIVPKDQTVFKSLLRLLPKANYEIGVTIQTIGIDKKEQEPVGSIHVYNKDTAQDQWIGGYMLSLSDKEYDFFREIAMQQLPKYEWLDKEAYMKTHIASYADCVLREMDLMTPKSRELLKSLFVSKWRKFKTRGYVDFETNTFDRIAGNIIETLLEKGAQTTE